MEKIDRFKKRRQKKRNKKTNLTTESLSDGSRNQSAVHPFSMTGQGSHPGRAPMKNVTSDRLWKMFAEDAE